MSAETWTFIDADGTEWPLDVSLPVDGRGLPPARFVEDGVPGEHGTRIRQVRFGPREVAFMLHLTAADGAGLRTALRERAVAFNPAAGDGKLRNEDYDGNVRELVCRLARGWELSERLENGAAVGDWTEQLVVFRAAQPFWQDAADTETTFEVAEGETLWYPIPPLEVAVGTVWAAPTISNLGNMETHPVWTITGPGDGLSLVNLTTDRTLTLSTVLAAGDVITIDTRPGAKTVVDQDGINLYPDLTSRDLWPLAAGDNDLEIYLDNVTSETSVKLARRHRWLMA